MVAVAKDAQRPAVGAVLVAAHAASLDPPDSIILQGCMPQMVPLQPGDDGTPGETVPARRRRRREGQECRANQRVGGRIWKSES